MSDIETRQVSRDSLFLLAQVRIAGHDEIRSVKVRNLSSGGMMAEGGLHVSPGLLLSVELRNIGWVSGVVAWKQGDRFGTAFAQEIDPRLARSPLASSPAANLEPGLGSDQASPRFTRPTGSLVPTVDPRRLRRV